MKSLVQTMTASCLTNAEGLLLLAKPSHGVQGDSAIVRGIGGAYSPSSIPLEESAAERACKC